MTTWGKSTRRDFLRSGGIIAAGISLAGSRVGAVPTFDLVLHGGTVIDGTGGPAYRADIGITGDRISAVEFIPADAGRRAVDLTGLHVAPGFIDIHTHSDGDILVYRGADSRIRQGITTEVTGNCGGSAAPLNPAAVEELRKELRADGVDVTWSDVDSYLAVLDRTGVANNQALLLGQGTLRRNAAGLSDRPLTADELASVLRAVETGMDQGAFGLSTGLEYTPGRYTPPDEIVAMAREVARLGGLYASHIRDEEAGLLEAVDEAINVGRRSGVRVEISHLKASGRPNWDMQQGALDLIASARRDGINVLADAYPYTAFSTGLTILLSDAALEGGRAAMIQRLHDPDWRSRMRKEVDQRMARELGDYALIVIARVKTPVNQPLVGRNLVEIAKAWGIDPADAVLRLIDEEEGSVSLIGHGMNPENVEKVLRHPLVMIGSDGSSMAPTGRAAQARPHPRSYGAFARVLGYYTRERRLFGLEEAVRKMTSMPADQVGLRDRGRIARGMKADLVAFSAASIRDEATFEDPHRYAGGIPHVFVNGVAVVERGQPTGARPGRALRR
jgi:N-acyl-D-amino-acid deacylase